MPGTPSILVSVLVLLALDVGVFPRIALAQESATPGSADHGEVNNGQDPTRPVRRSDVRYQYQVPGEGLDVNLLTLRMDWPFALGKDWKLNTRADVPIVHSNVPSADNPEGDYDTGLGDVLLQGLLIRVLSQEWAVLGGLQAKFPTASADQFGSGSMLVLPTVGGRYAPQSWPKGWWLAGLARYELDVWKEDGRESTSDLVLQPVFNMALPRHWFATLTSEMKYSLIEDAWFVPIDVTAGTMISPTTIVSIEVKQELYNAHREYEWAMELRVGFFF